MNFPPSETAYAHQGHTHANSRTKGTLSECQIHATLFESRVILVHNAATCINKNYRILATRRIHTNFLRISYEFLTKSSVPKQQRHAQFLRTSGEFLTNCRTCFQESFQKLPHKQFLRISCEFHTNFLRISYEFLTNFLRMSYEFLTNGSTNFQKGVLSTTIR